MKKGTREALYREIGYPTIDHMIYTRKEKGKLFSFAYSTHMEDLEKLIAFCKKNDMVFYITGSGEYYNNGTCQIVFTDKDLDF